MSAASTLIGVIDLPGNERDALVDAIARDGVAVCAVDRAADLPDDISLVVVHARAVPSCEWHMLSNRWPTLVVSAKRDDDDLLKAVDAGLVDYVIDPLRHAYLLRRMIRRVLDVHRLAQQREADRRRLEELNENLETHLVMLRLDQQAGGQIQRRLLPARSQQFRDICCDYWMAPSLYLSGDFLDIQAFNERYTLFYFADVSGHGASSAFVTVLLKYLFNQLQSQWDGLYPEQLPPRWLKALNGELLDTGIGKHATLFVGVIDQQRHYLHYSLGAQLPMPLLKSGSETTILEGEGMPVGLFPQAEYPQLGCDLPDDFSLWLCSDGVLECLPGDSLEVRLEELRSRVMESENLESMRRSLALGTRGEDDDTDDPAADREELPDDLTIMLVSGFRHEC
ncbi:PP2C family protein-serine/threonine phosphatase [Halomonas binhaiensis]|uniref:SpoIIE family protein phosphatase n=1 Tax=Halomonas binhaiensis TaxID=2562282 RepID=A0A5C1NEK2_9GAMM|nr:SpoIIE family protein phosphatase [Halomonas binhaiensis]QEM81290.1 SpoIIE family protein phosphatase [Halomonas binhaiensis]